MLWICWLGRTSGVVFELLNSMVICGFFEWSESHVSMQHTKENKLTYAAILILHRFPDWHASFSGQVTFSSSGCYYIAKHCTFHVVLGLGLILQTGILCRYPQILDTLVAMGSITGRCFLFYLDPPSYCRSLFIAFWSGKDWSTGLPHLRVRHLGFLVSSLIFKETKRSSTASRFILFV